MHFVKGEHGLDLDLIILGLKCLRDHFNKVGCVFYLQKINWLNNTSLAFVRSYMISLICFESNTHSLLLIYLIISRGF